MKNTPRDAVRFQGIEKSFLATRVLSGIDFAIAEGDFFALLGPNGAGKSTLINVLCGLARADRGTAHIFGHDVISYYRLARQNIGLVPQELVQEPFFPIRDLLKLQSGYFGIKNNSAWIDDLLSVMDLSAKADSTMKMLSGGMKRRALIALALVHKPRVVVLDEPTAGVDIALRHQLWAFIKGLHADGHTIILTTHYLEEAEELCNTIGIINKGRMQTLAAKDDLLAREGSLEKLFLNMVRNDEHGEERL